MDPKFRIGYWLTDKKKSKLKIDQVEQLLKDEGYELIRITKLEDFEKKGPFSVFFHKFSDITIDFSILRDNQSSKRNLSESEKWILKYKDYINKYPWTRVLDPLTKIENLLDRNRQYQLVVQKKKDDSSYFIPSFIELKTKDKEMNIRLLRDNDVKFPIVCKPLIAHGSTLAHQMSLVFCENGLDDIKTPCVAQTFINHSAKLYKLYVLKNQYFIVERPSLKNFSEGNFPTVHFDSHHISKGDSACELNKMSKEDHLRLHNRELNKELLDKIVDSICDCFKLTFFGIDVIIEDTTGKYVIIDINNFPAYDGVIKFAELFKTLLIEESKTAMYLRKSSLTDQAGDSTLTYTSNRISSTIYTRLDRIYQWFFSLNKKVV